MPKDKDKEMTMLSIPRTLHTRFKNLAEKEGRTMRGLMEVLVTQEEKKLGTNVKK